MAGAAPIEKPREKVSPLRITFSTERGGVEYFLNPESEDIYITINSKDVSQSLEQTSDLDDSQGSTDSGSESGEQSVSSMEMKSSTDTLLQSEASEELTEKVLEYLRKAQEAFYTTDFELALSYVEKSLQLKASAEGFALKGSILYMSDKLVGAKKAWNQALQLNPDMPGVIDMLNRIKKENRG